jgi:N-acetylneuraminate synthase
MKLGPLSLDTGDSCVLVAELGTSHGGDLKRAFDMVDAAADAGADCIKFQMVFADEILHPRTGRVVLPAGGIELYRYFKDLERPPAFYAAIKDRVEAKGRTFLCTPFGLESARALAELDCVALKIASPELNHYPLLREVASYRIPLILSTGVSTLADIERAVAITGELTILLHCVTSYPAPEEEYNLRLLPALSTIFGVPTGISDHSLDPLLVPITSLAMGGVLIEKHFTISREGDGLDDPIALDAPMFASMAEMVRRFEKRDSKETFDWLRGRYDPGRIDRLLGTGRKRLAPSEKENYGRTNRSIHALEDLQKGQIIAESRIALLRSEKNLTPGLGPEYLNLVIGKRTNRFIAAGEGVNWSDIA